MALLDDVAAHLKREIQQAQQVLAQVEAAMADMTTQALSDRTAALLDQAGPVIGKMAEFLAAQTKDASAVPV